MTVIALPTRTSRRYGGAVTSGLRESEEDQGDVVRSLAARLVEGDETALEAVYDRWSALDGPISSARAISLALSLRPSARNSSSTSSDRIADLE